MGKENATNRCFASAVVLTLLLGCGDQGDQRSGHVLQVTDSTSAKQVTKATDSGSTGRLDSKSPDDGRSLWASLTEGGPIDSSIVPDSSELILHVRPQSLLSSEEGRLLWQALGPAGERAKRQIEEHSNRPLSEIDTLVLGLKPGESYQETDAQLLIDPQSTDTLPLLRRDLEALLETSDSERHVTLLFTPSFLLGDGGALLTGQWAPVREVLFAATRDEWRAAALSLHCGEVFYWELRVVGDASMPEMETSHRLKSESERWPDAAQTATGGRSWSPHSAKVVGQYPLMVEVLSRHTRRGVDHDQAMLNGCLPPTAGHNLLLAAELYLAESVGLVGVELVGETPRESEQTVTDRLKGPVTVVFARESLETAVRLVSDAIGAPITIQGRDLQLEGITRNQMLSLDVTDRPAAEALVEVLRRANPDSEATGPADPRQKLVYIVQEDGSGDQQIIISTRSAATSRGDSLPKIFTD